MTILMAALWHRNRTSAPDEGMSTMGHEETHAPQQI